MKVYKYAVKYYENDSLVVDDARFDTWSEALSAAIRWEDDCQARPVRIKILSVEETRARREMCVRNSQCKKVLAKIVEYFSHASVVVPVQSPLCGLINTARDLLK